MLKLRKIAPFFKKTNLATTLIIVITLTSAFSIFQNTKPGNEHSELFKAQVLSTNVKNNQTDSNQNSTSPTPSVIINASPETKNIKAQATEPVITVSPRPTPNRIPSPSPKTESSGSLIDQVNAFRQKHNLPSVQSDDKTCDFAKIRAKEITTSFNHDGFQKRAQENTLPYPSYSKVVENIAKNSNPQKVIEGWINSEGHAKNMLEDTSFVCIAQEGEYFVYEGYKP